ncbi:hypothetical protein LTS16_000708 [Friedmanniomyces endolithicus]|nr:hypothetical protein LTR59_000857 [Friedmanniomyces endolithicus]KAK1055062.1 hypothetical protein LTS16_000708 [Friedmanniomyces endolithicus]
MLYKHLKAELPSLQKELNEKYNEVVKELEKLSEKRATARNQRRFLTKIKLNPFLEDDKNAVDPALNKEYAQFSAY